MRNKIQNARVKASPTVLIVGHSTMTRYLLAGLSLCAALLLSNPVHATTVALSPVAKQQFLSAAGVPLAAGCIYTYAGGTTTFLATYTDSTGTTQNSDPIQLDSGGFANIWITASAIKFAVYSNPTGGACPGTPGGSLVLQYTVDNITTSTGSGGGPASSVVSAGANPASSGIIEMTKSDTICWRNTSNSANDCFSIDGGNNLTWSGSPSFALPEGAAVSGITNEDILYADSTAHRLKMTNNAGSADVLSGAATTDTFTNKTFDTGGAGNVFKIAGTQVTAVGGACAANQFGTNTAISSGSIGLTCAQPSAANLSNGTTGSGAVVLATSPALTTPTSTSAKFNTGVANNGTGLEHMRWSGCALSASPGSTCNTSNNWPTAFADTSYTVACVGVPTANNTSVVVSVYTKSTTALTINEFNNNSASSTPEIDCIGIHD